MTNPKRTETAGKSGKSAFWPRVLGLGALTFALFLVIFLGYDLLMSIAETSAAEAAVTQQPPVVIDPKIANDLAVVLAADQSPNLQQVQDPFTDSAGLSGTTTGGTTTSATSGGSTSSSSSAQAPTTSGTAAGTASSSGSTTTTVAPATSATEATRDRYNEWVARITAYGDMPLDPRLFAIEDLLPVGIVDGGNGNQEVMFYSEAAGRTVSFMVGTSFFDGRLTELRPEGVVFSSFDGRQPIRMRSWARSIKTTD